MRLTGSDLYKIATDVDAISANNDKEAGIPASFYKISKRYFLYEYIESQSEIFVR